jgi:hypothetical protein
MPSTAKRLGKIALSTLLYMIVFDLAGVALCFFFEVAPVRGTSTALFYTIWLVLGVLCGLFSYNTGGGLASPKSNVDWSARADSGKAGLRVILAMLFVLAALSIACYLLLWRYHPESSFFVPDSAPPTLTFFGAIFASAIFAHKSLRPEPAKSVSRTDE